MKSITLITGILLIIVIGCNQSKEPASDVEVITTKGYELHRVKNSNKTLVLFPGGGTTAKEIKADFNILPIATEHNISVLMVNFNRHLWIDKIQTERLSNELDTLFLRHNLNYDHVFIGGMSIGGNVALTLSNYLIQTNNLIAPEGVFIVDSPIDLFALYESATKDLLNSDFDEQRLAEPRFIINYFTEEFGKDSLVENIQRVSPFTLKTGKNSVPDLSKVKLRFYTEPDSVWWQKNRQTDFENTNAYVIQQIAKNLKKEKWTKFELIETENKGYRSNGDRHPHSWSIVDIEELLNWVK